MTQTAAGVSTPRRLSIEVHQLPPPECSPNARGHWSKRYRAGREYGAQVFYLAVDARNKAGLRQPFARTRLDLTFVFSQVRGRDIDNLIAGFKVGQDAIVRAGLVQNDTAEHLVLGSVSIKIDRARSPLTIIEIEEMRQ